MSIQSRILVVTHCRCSQHRVEWGRLGSNGVETGGRGTPPRIGTSGHRDIGSSEPSGTLRQSGMNWDDMGYLGRGRAGIVEIADIARDRKANLNIQRLNRNPSPAKTRVRDFRKAGPYRKLIQKQLPIQRIPPFRHKAGIADHPPQLFFSGAVGDAGGAHDVLFQHD